MNLNDNPSGATRITTLEGCEPVDVTRVPNGRSCSVTRVRDGFVLGTVTPEREGSWTVRTLRHNVGSRPNRDLAIRLLIAQYDVS